MVDDVVPRNLGIRRIPRIVRVDDTVVLSNFGIRRSPRLLKLSSPNISRQSSRIVEMKKSLRFRRSPDVNIPIFKMQFEV